MKMIWVAMDTELENNPKAKNLRNALGLVNIYEAVGRLHAFWSWCMKNADRHGRLIGSTEEDIANAFGWRGDVKKLILALIAAPLDCETGLLEYDNKFGCYKVHGWEETQASWYKLQDEREAAAKRMERARNRRQNSSQNNTVNGTENSSPNGSPNRTENSTENSAENNSPNSSTNGSAHIPVTRNPKNQGPDDEDDVERDARARTREGDDGEIITERPPTEEEVEAMAQQWEESFGTPPNPSQVMYLRNTAWSHPVPLVKAAIRDVALRGVEINRAKYISEVLATWRAARIKTEDELGAWLAEQRLKEPGHAPVPKSGAPPNLQLVPKEG